MQWPMEKLNRDGVATACVLAPLACTDDLKTWKSSLTCHVGECIAAGIHKVHEFFSSLGTAQHSTAQQAIKGDITMCVTLTDAHESKGGNQ